MDLIQAIKQRHSVRDYLDKPIEPEKIKVLQAEIDECNKLSGLNFQLVINEPEGFSGFMASYGNLKSTNNYVALVGKISDKLEEQVGYYGERIVLKAQMLGLNTCWVGLTYNKKKVKVKIANNEKLVCVLALGYGKTQGFMRKSKKPEQVCNLTGAPKWFVGGVELALLAPTAINQQKFYFEYNGNVVSATAGRGPYAKVDLGIVKYHFEIGAGKENFVWSTEKE